MELTEESAVEAAILDLQKAVEEPLGVLELGDEAAVLNLPLQALRV